MSERAFTDTFVQQARATLTHLEIKVVGPLHLQTKNQDGSEGTVFLTNAYTQYTSSPDDLQAIIGNHISAMKMSEQDYVTTVAAQSAKAGVDREIPFVVENLNEDLRVLYVLDTESSMQMLTKEGVKQTGVAESALRSVAVKNLLKYFGDSQVQIERLEKTGKGKIYLVTLDENYEASILLLDDYWNKKNFDVAGDIIAFVPARNVVLVTGSEDKEGLRIASDVARNAYDELGYPISPHGYRRGAIGWTRFEP